MKKGLFVLMMLFFVAVGVNAQTVKSETCPPGCCEKVCPSKASLKSQSSKQTADNQLNASLGTSPILFQTANNSSNVKSNKRKQAKRTCKPVCNGSL